MSKFFWLSLSQIFDASNGFLDFDLLIFFLFCLRWQTLPWQSTFDEVHKHHSDLLQIIPACLLNAQMSVEAGVASSPCQLLIVLVRDVSTSSGVFIPLGQSKVNYIDNVLLLSKTDQEIVRFDISMKETILMNKFNTLEHLDR